MQDFLKLDVWQRSHQLVIGIYRATESFPKQELYGLTSQFRRCAVSVPTNIAEGCGRSTAPDFKRFLSMAMGSAAELQYYVILARDLGYLTADQASQLISEVTGVKRMLSGLMDRVGGSAPC